MRKPDDSRTAQVSIIICVALLLCGSLPLFAASKSLSTSLTIANNSGREIRNVYLSHVDADDWGNDQLSNSIASGQSYTLDNITWDASQVKVVAEDQDGCFLSTVVTIGQSSTWTINSDTTRDCGY